MALRIESILIIGIGLVFALLLFQDKSGVDAIESNSSKEFSFNNFSLIEITPKGVENRLSAKEAIKYTTHFELQEINITYKNTQHLLATKATYQDNFIYLDQSVLFKRDDGLEFKTEKLEYSIKSKKLYADKSFYIDMNESHIAGENLQYDLDDKNISAQEIRAMIYLE